MRIVHLGAAAAALLTAACSGQPGDNAQAPANGQTAAAGTGAAAGGGRVTLQPGQWETTVEVLRVSMPNMPAGMSPPTPQPVTASYCLTPEQAANPDASMMSGNAAQSGCTTENYSMNGGRIQGAISCNIQGTQTRSTIDGQFTPTTYQMNVTAQTAVAGTQTETETRITARRTGDCPAG